MMKWCNKSSVQSLDSQLDYHHSTLVLRESTPTHRLQLDFQLNSQQLTLVRRVRRSRTSTTPHTPNLILNLIAARGNFSEKSGSVTGIRHTRHTHNLIPNLIVTGNFSEKVQTHLTYPNLILNLIVTSNFSAGRDRAPPQTQLAENHGRWSRWQTRTENQTFEINATTDDLTSDFDPPASFLLLHKHSL